MIGSCRRAALAACLFLLLGDRPGFAQAPAGPQSAPDSGFAAGVEVRRDRYRYHFDNPSSFDTTVLVPHFYEQEYDADNIWVTAGARYRLWGLTWQTDGRVAAWGNGLGSDYDTFFNPDGNTIVYGTTAVTDLLSWQAAQRLELGTAAGFTANVGYSYRRDRATFHPSDTVITQTKPPSRTVFFNTGRETTVSEVHEVRFGVTRSSSATSSPRATIDAGVSPATLARLTTDLPDKYPGAPIVAVAKGLTMDASLRLGWGVGRAAVGLAFSVLKTWSYSASSSFNRDAFAAAIQVSPR